MNVFQAEVASGPISSLSEFLDIRRWMQTRPNHC